MIKILELIATGFLVAGALPAMIESGWCYWLWLIGNSLGIVTHYKTGGKWFSVRDIVFLGIAVYGVAKA
ncbi:MAG: hypothetical protein ABII09_03680 [Planctomycetota bacterium]